VAAEVDAWFAGPVCAALIEAARKPELEPEAESVPPMPSEPPPEGHRWVLEP
jgi:hypothetical protein